MPLSVVRLVYRDDHRFASSIHAMLTSGDVALRDEHGETIPSWRWRELFIDGAWVSDQSRLLLELTDQGSKRTGGTP